VFDIAVKHRRADTACSRRPMPRVFSAYGGCVGTGAAEASVAVLRAPKVGLHRDISDRIIIKLSDIITV
jgi:hypothetical protein